MLSTLALVVVVVIDQYRTDELLRIHHQLNPAGIGRLVDKGIFYDDAHQTQFFNMTCPGHTAISTGAQPGLHGIMANEDWDRTQNKNIYCVSDPDHHWIDAEADRDNFEMGTSPKRIMTSTLGDEVKSLWPRDSKVVSVSVKDRAAIALGGHAADGAFWFAPKSHHWTSSDWYFPDKKLPPWLVKFNARYERDAKPADDEAFASSLKAVDDTTDVALAAVKNEKLGQHPKPDVLWISYSTHDYVGHRTGDDSPQLHAVMKEEDANVARLMAGLQKSLGHKKFMIVLTADHGAGVLISNTSKMGIPGGKLNSKETRRRLDACLEKEGIKSHGHGPVEMVYSEEVFLSQDLKDIVQAREKAKDCLLSQNKGLWGAFTRDEIMKGQLPRVPWLRRLASSYYPPRGPDVVMVLSPYWNANDAEPLGHETPYDYDSWVPLAIWWSGVKHHTVHHRVAVTSLAPTLARILDSRRPSGAMAPYLTEVLDAVH